MTAGNNSLYLSHVIADEHYVNAAESELGDNCESVDHIPATIANDDQ